MMPILRKAATDGPSSAVGQVRRDGAGNRIGLTTYTASS
jgi:hypothetical protein